MLNLVIQKQTANIQPGESSWYGGMSGNVQMINPIDNSLIAQRMFLVSVFTGTQF